VVLDDRRIAFAGVLHSHLADIASVPKDRAHARLRNLDALALQETRQLTYVGATRPPLEELDDERAVALVHDEPPVLDRLALLVVLGLNLVLSLVPEGRLAREVDALLQGALDARLEVRLHPPQVVLGDDRAQLEDHLVARPVGVDPVLSADEPSPRELDPPVGERALDDVASETIQAGVRMPSDSPASTRLITPATRRAPREWRNAGRRFRDLTATSAGWQVSTALHTASSPSRARIRHSGDLAAQGKKGDRSLRTFRFQPRRYLATAIAAKMTRTAVDQPSARTT
jgi:hypothetical protein